MHRPCTYLILSVFFSPQHFLPTRQKHLSESMHLVSNEVQPSFLNAVINHIPLHGIKSSSRGQPPTQFKHSEHRPHGEFNMRKLSSGESCVAARAPSTARQPWQRLPCGDVAQHTTPMVASRAVRTACFWSPPLSTVFITVAPSHWKYLRVHDSDICPTQGAGFSMDLPMGKIPPDVDPLHQPQQKFYTPGSFSTICFPHVT